jgi:7-cyano-7-deazaguanine reductase
MVEPASTGEQVQRYLASIRQDASWISSRVLEPLPYENPGRCTWVEIENPEFTSLCPKTGLPDFGKITIRYLPDAQIVELKSLKYYFLQYRNAGIFYEQITQLILGHLVAALDPFEMTIEARFTSRGGISSKITSTYHRNE